MSFAVNLVRKTLPRGYLQAGIHTTGCKQLFWEKDMKGGYGKPSKVGWAQIVKEGFKELKTEFKLFTQEVKEKFVADPILAYPPGVVDKIWTIREQNDLDTWITTCDSDHGEGFSSCSLILNNGHGLFSGNLSTDFPKDGKIKRSGYCTVRTKRMRKSFKRDAYLDWNPYNHLVLRVRGDGRSYMLNISTCGIFDQMWNDVYHYILFTRGGPYWQIVKIPFSKFFLSSKGRIQDIQSEMPLGNISHFGITAADKVNGPFSLEIDYIGLENVPSHEETTAYEMYKTYKNIAAN
ncbi:complex I intermediate-associated protein 30, mitochondrial [Cimex lectularius]|uniref:NADH:ubiquinone oxidoreductase intermediate-associated protein 30 domain-containing protein n=1 Tax=Cimex lectularius TaxID=79782 RepID=A0A8I6RIR8_CIMLE|nr:complex I intermediate-associated protein 30, mitochondrial [Cimex lectularius]